ncbi:hypothetical protein BRD56_05620 [Thermoplasmatales archaeon SW_10_69_26]|nr:MAG: hypothetical protein BRD56_05620 [Thermoplasmatales archaeon SW_10_69_26]
MKRALVLGLLLVAAGAAGCLGGDDASDDAEAASAADEGNETDTANDSAALEEADLSEPPTWTPGMFWEVQIEDANTGETHQITRIVASETGNGYRVGMPADGFSHPAVLAHFPGFGTIDAQTLGFSVHGEPFQALSFPLEEGQTWSTTLYETDLEAEVLSTTDQTAEIGMTGEGTSVNLTYDADQRAITELEGPLGASMQVTDHGTGYAGPVKVPHDREQFIDGRVVGAIDLQLQPAPPTGSASVPDAKDEASFAQIVGNIDVAPGQPGHYQETTTDPAGETTEIEVTQVGGGLTAAYGSSTEAGGEWTFEHVAGGFGAAATEIIAYRTQVVDLPVTDDTANGT